MKIEIGSYGAKTKLPELLRQVKTGKSFAITNRGEAIADLVSMGQMGSWANGVRSFNMGKWGHMGKWGQVFQFSIASQKQIDYRHVTSPSIGNSWWSLSRHFSR